MFTYITFLTSGTNAINPICMYTYKFPTTMLLAFITKTCGNSVDNGNFISESTSFLKDYSFLKRIVLVTLSHK